MPAELHYGRHGSSKTFFRTLIARQSYYQSSQPSRSEEHTSELQSPCNLVCRLLLEKKKGVRSQATATGPARSRRSPPPARPPSPSPPRTAAARRRQSRPFRAWPWANGLPLTTSANLIITLAVPPHSLVGYTQHLAELFQIETLLPQSPHLLYLVQRDSFFFYFHGAPQYLPPSPPHRSSV